MAPVARELASFTGVLEPFQTAITLEGQVDELRTVLESHGAPTNILIGFSWGAWLSFILAACYPSLVRKLILVGSGPFEDKYVASMQECRLGRLSAEERTQFESSVAVLTQGKIKDNTDSLLKQLGELASKTDTYDAIPCEESSDLVTVDGDIFQAVMRDATEVRRSGKLLKLAGNIVCPVVAIHGSYDPHPAEGVEQPLRAALRDFRFILLNNCGHKPWIERQAKAQFYEILRQELRQ
ncbi:MAG: alpha/beta hydrolase [Candidatus Melainabacteria bacterium]|nr:alpha/beta hydrolase [Candidatus Melainabacteria bacterium]